MVKIAMMLMLDSGLLAVFHRRLINSQLGGAGLETGRVADGSVDGNAIPWGHLGGLLWSTHPTILD
jgi:hypothetical protein